MSNLNLQKLRKWVWPWPWTFKLNKQQSSIHLNAATLNVSIKKLNIVAESQFLLLCRIHFSWLSRTKWIIFPDWFVHAKYQCRFSIICNHIRNKNDGTKLKVEVQMTCKQNEQKIS